MNKKLLEKPAAKEKPKEKTTIKEKPAAKEEKPEILLLRKQVDLNYKAITSHLQAIENLRNSILSLRVLNEEIFEKIGDIRRHEPIK